MIDKFNLMSPKKIISGQSAELHSGFLRLGFFINEQSTLNLFAASIPKSFSDISEIVWINNKQSSCGRIVSFGVQNHWVYEIDLRCLEKRYDRIVLAISNQLDRPQSATAPCVDVDLLADIEGIGTFTVNMALPSSRILRILEVYAYHGTPKIKAFGDFFLLKILRRSTAIHNCRRKSQSRFLMRIIHKTKVY